MGRETLPAPAYAVVQVPPIRPEIGAVHAFILYTLYVQVPPIRPEIGAVPFSTELVLERCDAKWMSNLENPYYLYPASAFILYTLSGKRQ